MRPHPYWTHIHTHRHTHTCIRARTDGFVVARFIASTKFRDNHRRSGNLVTPPAAKRAPRQNRFHVVIRFAIYFAIPHKRRGHHEEGITHTHAHTLTHTHTQTHTHTHTL
jgi:hypothetical protein